MSDSPTLFDVHRRFTATMATSFDINDVLHELCDQAVSILGASGAGVCLGNEEGVVRFVTATSEQSVVMEHAQEEFQEGPCLLAYQTGETVAISRIDELAKWPDYRAAAESTDLISVVGIPMALGERSVGALNVYDAHERQWSGDDLDAAGLLADMATAYLLRAGELAESRQLAEQLQHALDSRVIIEQAKGMLARDHRISVDEAFALLRQHSRNTKVGLRVIAHAIVELNLQISTPQLD